MSSRSQKIILLGQTNVGKTAILLTFINNRFPDKTMNTLGSSFHTHTFIDSQQQKIKMDIWDTAGQQKYRSLLGLYYKNTDGVIITFDINNIDTLQAVQYWTKQIQENCQNQPCVILVANKSDLLYSANKSLSKPIDDKKVNKFLSINPIGNILFVVPNKIKILKNIRNFKYDDQKKKKQRKTQEKNSRHKIKKNKLGSQFKESKGCC